MSITTEQMSPSDRGRVVDGRTVAASLKERSLRLARSHPILPVLCLLAAVSAFYFALIAAPVFVSSTQISIRGKESAPSTGLLGAFLPTSGSGGLSESVAVREFIHSPQMFEQLETRHDLREHYGSFRLDGFNSISRKASNEAFLEFYRNRVDVTLDREAAILAIDVNAFDADTALSVANSIVELSENYVNDLSARIREATLADATAELAGAAEDIRTVRLQLAEFRNRSGELDPASRGAGTVASLIALEADITRFRSELASQLTINQPDAPQIREIEARIESLERQAQAQRLQLASEGGDGTLAEVLLEYEGLVIEREYAETRLTAALAALDGARQLADQRERFVVTIVDPVLPSVATRPRRWAGFIFSLLVGIIGYGIVRYTVAGIMDHDSKM